jgi:hypothetical protein
MRRIGLWWLITTITANVAIVSMAEGQGSAMRAGAWPMLEPFARNATTY